MKIIHKLLGLALFAFAFNASSSEAKAGHYCYTTCYTYCAPVCYTPCHTTYYCCPPCYNHCYCNTCYVCARIVDHPYPMPTVPVVPMQEEKKVVPKTLQKE